VSWKHNNSATEKKQIILGNEGFFLNTAINIIFQTFMSLKKNFFLKNTAVIIEKYEAGLFFFVMFSINFHHVNDLTTDRSMFFFS